MSKTVYPVEGALLMGIPHAPLAVDAKVATRLVRTGAFTDDKPKGKQPDPVELSDEATARLDFYDPPTTQPDEPEGPSETPEV